MKKTRRVLLVIAMMTALSYQGCDIATQVQHGANLVNCEFRIHSVRDVTLAGINIQDKQSIKDLNAMDAAKILASLNSGTFPLALLLNLEGRNPNASPAGLNRLEWILFIDDIQMTTGVIPKAFTIPPANGTTLVPIQLSLDLKQVLKGKSLDAIVNFGFNLAGTGNKPTRFLVRLKPTIMIGDYALTYPGYINAKTEFTSL